MKNNYEIISGPRYPERKREELVKVYQAAFRGHPWYENLSVQEVNSRLDSDFSRIGFNSFLAEDSEGFVMGGLWYDTPTLEDVRRQRGEELASYTQKLMEETGIKNIVWERELMVDPKHQGQGLGTNLRETFLLHLSCRFPDGVLILTRMKEDNYATLRIAEKLQYQDTGIRIESSVFKGQFHQYWYKISH
ncbi:MAG: hypothetical protein ACOX6N_04825 [Patescibacteria group bacterium]|jgi:GNAT superfamily N-acetyltransferase